MGDATQKAPVHDVRGQMLGGFRIEKKLGQGAMGTVFLARQRSVDRLVALKVLTPRLAKNREYVDRFLREARAAAQLSHVNIVQAIDAGHADGYYYFAMEYVDGQSLRQVLDQRGPLPEAAALRIARQIALALDHAHTNAKLIHRDIKPENILIGSDGTPKLADLGLAREVERGEASLTKTGVALGTPNYISPEQVRGEADLDGRTDLYSLGATLFHLLTGAPPYVGGTAAEVMAKHLSDPVPDPRTANPRVSPATAAIVRKAMMKNRRQRYQTAHEMAEDLGRAIAGASTVSAAAAAPSLAAARTAPGLRKPRRRRASPLPYVIGISAAVLLAVVFWAIATSGPSSNTPTTGTASPTAVVAHNESPVPKLKDIDTSRDTEIVITDLPKDVEPPDPAAVEAERKRAAEEFFARLAARARTLADTGDYDAAIAVYREIPDEYKDDLSEQADAATAALGEEAEGKIKPVMAEAEKLGEQGEPEKGLEELEKVEELKYQPLAGPLAELRKKLEDVLKARKDKDLERQVAAAADEAVKKLLTTNRSLHDEYAKKCEDIRRTEMAELEAKYKALNEALNNRIKEISNQIDRLEARLRAIPSRIVGDRPGRDDWRDRLRDRDRWRPPGGGDPFARVRQELRDAIAKLRDQREELEESRTKLIRQALADKNKVLEREARRKKQVRTVFDNHNKILLTQGAKITVEDMRRNYEATLKVE